MRKIMKKMSAVVLIFAMVIALNPAGGAVAAPASVANVAEVAAQKVSATAPTTTKSVTLKVGTTKTLEISGEGITSTTFTSTRPSIASVSSDGTIKALKYGTTIIKTTVDYGMETKTLKTVVTVVKKKKFTAANVYKKIMAKKKKYPEGKSWTNANSYTWNAFPGIRYIMAGCAGFAAIMSDAAFGKKTPAREVKNPKAAKVRVGDMLRLNNDTHSVIVLKVETDGFVIAEGNYNYSIHWGRKIPKNEPISYLYTRYDA
ncbi:MAG: Ig-like domain-containing protein [Eubacterium sp.]|nr:Ig-like domain-containing protein [Eubacterium sp.]